MALPIDPSRSVPPPLASFLAEAALQRQTALLGLEKPKPAAPAPLPTADPGAPPPSVASPSPPGGPLPAPADLASISPQAREQLASGFDPRRGGAADGSVQGPRGESAARVALPGSSALARNATPAAPAHAAASAASGTGGAAWPASGLSAPLLRLVSALVVQVTAQAGVPQRVLAAQPWPIGMAQALESGVLDADQPPLQTWLVRQGVVATPEGPRGLALTLRAPVPWLAAQASPAAAGAAAVPAGASLGAGAPAASGALQVPFAGGGQALQSGVMALVLQGMDAAAPRTSALLVLDLQPQLAATVYGRDMLQQATGRLDPWTQMAVLQASGQVPREDERARNGASGLCDTVGCPYAARAACVQPFCLAMRSVLPAEAMGPGPRA